MFLCNIYLYFDIIFSLYVICVDTHQVLLDDDNTHTHTHIHFSTTSSLVFSYILTLTTISNTPLYITWETNPRSEPCHHKIP